MSDRRPYTSIGLPHGEPYIQPELRRSSLDPNTILASQEPQALRFSSTVVVDHFAPHIVRT